MPLAETGCIQFDERSGRAQFLLELWTLFLSRDRYQYLIRYKIPVLNGKNYSIEKVKYCIASLKF